SCERRESKRKSRNEKKLRQRLQGNQRLRLRPNSPMLKQPRWQPKSANKPAIKPNRGSARASDHGSTSTILERSAWSSEAATPIHRLQLRVLRTAEAGPSSVYLCVSTPSVSGIFGGASKILLHLLDLN